MLDERRGGTVRQAAALLVTPARVRRADCAACPDRHVGSGGRRFHVERLEPCASCTPGDRLVTG